MRADRGAGAQVERGGRSDGFPKDRLGCLLKALRSHMEVLEPKTQLVPSKWFLVWRHQNSSLDMRRFSGCLSSCLGVWILGAGEWRLQDGSWQASLLILCPLRDQRAAAGNHLSPKCQRQRRGWLRFTCLRMQGLPSLTCTPEKFQLPTFAQ